MFGPGGRVRRPARSAPARCTTSTPRASRPSRRRPARPAGPPACRRDRRRPRPPRGPGSRRCCSEAQRTSAPSATSVSISTAVWIVMCSEPVMRAPASGCASAYSRRVAIRPGISCSASRISLRPKSASGRSATLKSVFAAVVLIGSPRVGDQVLSVAQAAASSRWCLSCSKRSQSAGSTSSGRRGCASSQAPTAPRSSASAASRAANATSERPMSKRASSSFRVRSRCSSAGP